MAQPILDSVCTRQRDTAKLPCRGVAARTIVHATKADLRARFMRARRAANRPDHQAVGSELGLDGRLKNSLSIPSRGRDGPETFPKTATYCHLLPFWTRKTATPVATVSFVPWPSKARQPASHWLWDIGPRSSFLMEAGGGWGRRPNGDAPRSEDSAPGARGMSPARARPPSCRNFLDLFAHSSSRASHGAGLRTANGAKRSRGGMLPSSAVCHMTRESTSTDDCIRDCEQGRYLTNPRRNSQRAERPQIPSANPPSTKCMGRKKRADATACVRQAGHFRRIVLVSSIQPKTRSARGSSAAKSSLLGQAWRAASRSAPAQFRSASESSA